MKAHEEIDVVAQSDDGVKSEDGAKSDGGAQRGVVQRTAELTLSRMDQQASESASREGLPRNQLGTMTDLRGQVQLTRRLKAHLEEILTRGERS